MKLIEKEIICKSRADVFHIRPIGDVHLGERNCAEKQFRKEVNEIRERPGTFWFGGGDLLGCIKPGDIKRFDMDVMPDWMLEGDATTTREMLNDMLNQQFERLALILEPIASQCLGCIEGNHEYSIRKYHNDNIHQSLCNRLGVPNLTDEFMARLTFKRLRASAVVKIYATHGWGGGRTAGAEPNKLQRMMDEWEDADICFRGHSHTFSNLPPKPVMYIPNAGKLPSELEQRYRFAANWGCFVKSHTVGPSSYVSRACYPARPLLSVIADIKPFSGNKTRPQIELRQIIL